MTVDHVPAGSGYQLVLTLGSKPDGSTFVPGQFAQSGTFDVTAGHETDVALNGLTTVAAVTGALDANQAPYNLQYDSGLLGKNVRGVAVSTDANYASWIGAADGTTLYRGQSFPLSGSSGSLPPGATANSVSDGALSSGSVEFLVSTTRGIVPFGSTGTYGSQTVFPQNYGPSGDIENARLSSYGNFSIPAGLTDYYVYRTANGGLGGITTISQTSTTAPFSVDLSSGSATQVVLDFSMDSGDPNLFLATSAGAFAVSPELFTAGNADFNYLSTYGANVTVHLNGKDRFIASLVQNGSSARTYAGTNSGVYVTTLGTVDSYIGNIAAQGGPGQKVDLIADLGGQLVPDTNGHPFSKIVSQTDYAQIVAVSNNLLVVYLPPNYIPLPPAPQYFVLPLVAVTLGDVNAVAVAPEYGSLTPSILIAGTKGLTIVPIGPPGG